MNRDVIKYLSNLQVAFIRAVFSFICLVAVWVSWILVLNIRAYNNLGFEGIKGSEIYIVCGMTAIFLLTMSFSLRQYYSWKIIGTFQVLREMITERIRESENFDNLDIRVEMVCKTPFTVAKFIGVKEPFVNWKRVVAVVISFAVVFATMAPSFFKALNTKESQYKAVCYTESILNKSFDSSEFILEHLSREEFIVNSKNIYEIQYYDQEDNKVLKGSVIFVIDSDGGISELLISVPLNDENSEEPLQTIEYLDDRIRSSVTKGLKLSNLVLPEVDKVISVVQQVLDNKQDVNEIATDEFTVIHSDSTHSDRIMISLNMQ